MTRATLAYLEGLSAPETFIHRLGRQKVNKFVRGQLEELIRRIRTDANGEKFIEPIELFSRLELADLTAQLGIAHDMDLAELYALGVMSAHNRGLHGYLSATELVIRRAITARTHTLMEQRTELLHPNLRVAKSAADEGDTWLLRFLVSQEVSLDPARLQRQATMPGPGRDVLQMALQQGKDFGAPLLEEATRPWRGCAHTALAIVLSDKQAPELDEHNITQLWSLCAAGVAAQQWQFDRALALLDAIRQRQDEAGGDGHRAKWHQGSELLETTDLSWASARVAHPTTGLVYKTAIKSAYIGDVRQADVAGFPFAPLSAAAAALNAILEPEFRMALSELNGRDLLKLTVLCPKASQNGAVRLFWARDPSGWNKNNLNDLLDWAVTSPDSSGQLPSLEFLDSQSKDFSDILGKQRFNEMRAKAANRMMADAIEAATILDSKTTPVATLRRARAV